MSPLHEQEDKQSLHIPSRKCTKEIGIRKLANYSHKNTLTIPEKEKMHRQLLTLPPIKPPGSKMSQT